MENTLDVWEIPAESATRVGHPAPFPIELPARLIELHTFRGDLVLDPFAGSGTTAVAALRAGRHYAGYDLDESYIGLAESRVEQERRELAREAPDAPVRVVLPAIPEPASEGEDFSRAVREGRAAKTIARSVIEAAGFSDIQKDVNPGE
jgi:site-specific DNA-methyltransferase (adenine-specific)